MRGDSEHVGRRLLPHVVDYQASKNADESFATIPLDLNDHLGPWRDFSFAELSRSVDYTAWWIEKQLVNSKKADVIGYVGVNDIRYVIFFLACIKTGRIAFFPSIRNTGATHSHLVQTLGYKDLVYTPERGSSVKDIQSFHQDMRVWLIPTLDEMVKETVRPFPFDATFEAEENTVVGIMHSSGTTGMPKPVLFTNGYFACYDNLSQCTPTEDGRNYPFANRAQGLHLVPGVFFHLMGFQYLLESILRNVKIIVASDRMMNERALAELIENKKPRSATLVSSVISSMYQAGYLKTLGTLDFVVFGGGPISEEAGAAVSKVTSMVSGYGLTEAGVPPYIIPADPKDWRYIQVLPEWKLEFEAIGDDLYEGVIKRHPRSRDFQGIFHTYPELEEYRTKDLFKRHPTLPGLYAYEGRSDDVIVLSNGEKFNPTEMETIIELHPKVKKAMVVGLGRFEPALVVEVDPEKVGTEETEQCIIDNIWPTVIQANETGYTHGRVIKTRIGIADKSLPFQLNAKGGIRRRHTVQDQAATIERIYAKPLYSRNSTLKKSPTLSEVKAFALSAVSDMLAVPDLTLSTDLIQLGTDSLYILQLVAFMRETVQSNTQQEVQIPAAWIYHEPTVQRIAEIIHNFLSGSMSSKVDGPQNMQRSELVQHLVKKYTEGLPTSTRTMVASEPDHYVILTGSTGSLGTYILHQLLKIPSVRMVYCLNRSAQGEAKQRKSFAQRGLDFEPSQGRTKFYQAAYGEERFGLPSEVYHEMKDSVDAVFHNAWEVNFNLPLEAFEKAHIQGVRRFIDFSLEGRRFPHIHFISSRGSVGGWDPKQGVVPEVFMEDATVADETGYGTSKHISERILQTSASISGVPVTVYRVGQIAGPSTKEGEWNRAEWLPTVVMTSKAIGRVPESLEGLPMDWMPVDVVATVFLDLVATRAKKQLECRAQVYHLSNPREADWALLLPTLQQHFEAIPVTFSDWVQTLETTPLTQQEIAQKPALRLLDFLKRVAGGQLQQASLSTKATCDGSVTLRDLGAADPELFDLYLTQWGL